MTSIYFVRHAQPDDGWEDDRTRPLTLIGIEDRKRLQKFLKKLILIFLSQVRIKEV